MDEEAERSGKPKMIVKHGSRTRADGSMLEWKINLPRGSEVFGDGKGEYGCIPFVIDWLSTDPSTHPSQTTPSGCTLLSMECRHPEPERITRELSNLGVNGLSVIHASKPELFARIQTPKGEVILGSPLSMLKIREALPSEERKVNSIYESLKFWTAKFDRDLVLIGEVFGVHATQGRLAATTIINERELAGIYVAEPFRRYGIARRIVMELLSRVPPNHAIYCIPFGHLLWFYESVGFEDCTELFNFMEPSIPADVHDKFLKVSSIFKDQNPRFMTWSPPGGNNEDKR
jgi:GNAT superfamily N-acetyltransferase